MTPSADDVRRKLLATAFQMPSVQTMVSRKSSITNAFVNSLIPTIAPTADEVDKALTILGMSPDDVRCAYCGDKSTEWDHLRPLVLNQRPTGYVSEIANLVPACGKCNQSKGNKPWRHWMSGKAKLSPVGRSIPGSQDRIARLDAYERWKAPTKVDFSAILGTKDWDHYWSLCDAVNAEMREAQTVADALRDRIRSALQNPSLRPERGDGL